MPPLTVFAITLALAAAAPAAHAEAPKPPPPFQKCAIPPDAKFYKSFRDLPEDIRRDFVKHRGAIAERGEGFGGDAFVYAVGADGVAREVDPRPQQRFVGAIESEHTWVIWYELWRGQLLVSASRDDLEAGSPGLSYRGEVRASQPCVVTDAFLSGMDVLEQGYIVGAP